DGTRRVVPQEPNGGFALDPTTIAILRRPWLRWQRADHRTAASITARSVERRLDSATDEDVLEELAGPPPGTAVDVPRYSIVEDETRVLEDRGIQVLRVVDDDEHPGIAWQLRSRVVEHAAHRVDVGVQRGLA